MTPQELMAALAEPFAADEIGWKPQAKSKDGTKALACAYIDARNVMDRLDAVVGPENWQDEFTPLGNGNVVCCLSLRVGGEWIHKSDVGGESDQKDTGDREKAAFSDALKRAAVKWGVGRYLYSLPSVWCEYDEQRKQFKGTPSLPSSALPKSSKPQPAAKPAPAKATASAKAVLPRDGVELFGRLKDYEAKLVARGLCADRALTQYVEMRGEAEGYGTMIPDWNADAIADSVAWVQEFEAARTKPQTAGVA
jgi:hypothetical protein